MAADYVLNRPESRPIHPAARAKSHSRNSRLSYQSSIEAAAPNNRPDSRTRSSHRESRLELLMPAYSQSKRLGVLK
uniref:Uncharacterized protein n=1 Tax=Ditylenchus dipsaci TaxID=166011 RepID=A0A915EKD4_9BILA